MSNTFKYYQYQGYYYRIEFDIAGTPINGAALRPDGSWYPINFGWEIILQNNTPISEEALHTARIKRRNPVNNIQPTNTHNSS